MIPQDEGPRPETAGRGRSPRLTFVLLLIVFVGAGLAYSWLMPPWEAPDEPAHYILAGNLARLGIFSELENNYEAHQPRPYYYLASVPLKWLYTRDRALIETYRPESNYNNIRTEAPVFEWTAESYRFVPGIYVLRWLNVLFAAAAVAVNAAALRRLLPEAPRIAFAAAVFLAFIPQFLHISSAVANDTLGSLAGALLFWAIVRIAEKPPGIAGYVLAAAAAVALPLGSKFSALPMGLALLAAIGLQVRRRRRIPWWAVIAGGFGLVALALLAGLLLLPEIARMWLRVIPGRLVYYFEGAFEPATMWMMVKQLAWTFWGQVGWIGAGLPGWMVLGLTGLAAVGVGSAVWSAVRERNEPAPGRLWVLITAGLALAVVFRNSFFTIANQGRLLFPALGPIAFAVVWGWSRILPERWRDRLPWVVEVLMLVANVWLVVDKIVPIYFQPGLDN